MKVQSTFLIIFLVHSYQKVFGWFQCPRGKHSGLHFKTQEIRSLFSGNSSWHSCSRRNQKDRSFFCPWAFSLWAVVRWVKRKVRVSSSRWRLAAEAEGRWGGGRGWLQLSVCWHAALHARFTLLNSSVCPPIHSREIRLFLNMQTKILQVEILPEAKEEETLVKLSDSYTLKKYECPNRLLCTCKFYI